MVFKPSLPPFNLIKTKDLSLIDPVNAFVRKFELRTDKELFPREIAPAPAIPKVFKKPLLSHFECSAICFLDFK